MRALLKRELDRLSRDGTRLLLYMGYGLAALSVFAGLSAMLGAAFYGRGTQDILPTAAAGAACIMLGAFLALVFWFVWDVLPGIVDRVFARVLGPKAGRP